MDLIKYLVLILLLHVVTLPGFQATGRLNATTLQPPLERMLSRKKRFLLMPKGGHLKFTFQLTKRLLAAFPRGFNFVIEQAVYYPMPGARIDLIPKRLRKPTTTTPKPIGTKPPIFVCIPGSLICYKAKPAAKPMKVQRIDENIKEMQWIDPQQHYGNYQKYQNYGQQYADPQKWAEWSKYGQTQQYQKYKWTPTNKQQNYYQKWQPKPQSTWTKWTTEAPDYEQQKQNYWSGNTTDYSRWTRPRFQQYQKQRRHQRWRRTLKLTDSYLPEYKIERNDYDFDPDSMFNSYEPMYFPDLEPYFDWPHYHGHRDRRQLFHQFEGLSQSLGFDMKSCIARAICESKRYLLPPGYSMILDILRLVFTLPTIDGLTDDYSRAMNADFETCDKFLRPKCTFNILNWFINSNKNF